MKIAHVLSWIPLLGARFQVEEYGVGGSRETPMKTAHDLVHARHAASYGSQARHISDLSDPDANYFVLLGGQDGWLGSANYSDQTTLWRTRRYVRVPLRPNLAFTGRAVDLMWFYALVFLFIAASWTQNQVLNLAVSVSEFVFYWLLVKWFVANLSSDGQPLGLRFSGSFWGFLGWSLLAVLSVITIVGWAWVYVAQIRWMCRHVEGTRRGIVFNGTGLEFLWRGIVTALLSVFIIPLPWAYRWFTRWLASQTRLVDTGAPANA